MKKKSFADRGLQRLSSTSTDARCPKPRQAPALSPLQQQPCTSRWASRAAPIKLAWASCERTAPYSATPVTRECWPATRSETQHAALRAGSKCLCWMATGALVWAPHLASALPLQPHATFCAGTSRRPARASFRARRHCTTRSRPAPYAYLTPTRLCSTVRLPQHCTAATAVPLAATERAITCTVEQLRAAAAGLLFLEELLLRQPPPGEPAHSQHRAPLLLAAGVGSQAGPTGPGGGGHRSGGDQRDCVHQGGLAGPGVAHLGVMPAGSWRMHRTNTGCFPAAAPIPSHSMSSAGCADIILHWGQ